LVIKLTENKKLCFPDSGMLEADVLAALQRKIENHTGYTRRAKFPGLAHAWRPSLGLEVYKMFIGYYPRPDHLQQEAVDMIVDFLGSKDATGDIVAGGTEANTMAVRAAFITSGRKSGSNLLIPETVHPWSFQRACDLMSIELNVVPVDKKTWTVDPKIMEEHINENTIGLVGSFGTVLEGAVDPIPELAQVAKKHGIYMHTDACWGGFIIPFAKRVIKGPIPDFDFRVDGVCSVSADPHKLLYVPQPGGGIFYRNEELRTQASFRTTLGTVGELRFHEVVTSYSKASSVPALWAQLKYYGREGYTKLAEELMKVTINLGKEIPETIPGFELMIDPKLNQLGFITESDPIKLHDELIARGWGGYNPVYDASVDPRCFRLIISAGIGPYLEDFMKDLKEVNAELLKK